MPIKLNCEMCGSFLGEINKGGVRHGAVSLCEDCWRRAKLAVGMADDAMRGVARDVPDVVNDLFGHFNKRP